MTRRHPTALLTLATIAALAACADGAGDPVAPAPSPARQGGGAVLRVTSAADAGAGSLRAAIEAASADPAVRHIRVDRKLSTIALQAPLVFSGEQALTLDGGGVVLLGNALPDGAAAPALDAALVANGGGDLTVRDLTVRGSTGNGILVDVPDAHAGAIVVTLDDVMVAGSRRHGVLVNDQVDYFADPETRADGGSPADVRVHVSRSAFLDNGFAGLDYDGLRVNEGGAGSLDVEIAHSRFQGNGADGVELDERGVGDAVFVVRHTAIERNGYFSSDDWDDGIDVDELGPGDLIGRFEHVTASGNAEQGVDLNENNLGHLRVAMHRVGASGNAEEGIEFEEDDDWEDFPAEPWGGDLVATLRHVTANGNGANDGDAGLKIREKADGDLTARVEHAETLDNAVGGVQVREGEAGSLDAELRHVVALRNDLDGVQVRESGAGALQSLVQSSTTSQNGDAGVRLRGNGTARLQRLTATGNAGGDVVAEPAVVVIRVP